MYYLRLYFCLGVLIMSSLPSWGQASRADSLFQAFHTQGRTPAGFITLVELFGHYDDTRRIDSQAKYAPILIQLGQEVENDSFFGYLYARYANVHFVSGEYAETLRLSDSALLYYQKYDKLLGLKRTHHLQGMAHLQLGKFEEALKAYQNSFDIAFGQGDTLVMGVTRDGMGMVHQAMRNFPQAKASFQEAIKLMAGDKFAYRRGISIANLATVQYQLEEYEQAIATNQQALAVFEALGADRWSVRIKGNLGNALSAVGRYEEALPLLEATVAHHRGRNIDSYQTGLGMLAEAHLRMGNLSRARALHEEALPISDSLGILADQRLHLEHLAEIAQQQGEYKDAHAYLQRAHTLADSLYNQATTEKVQELTQQFEAEKREQEIATLRAETELQEAAIAFDSRVRMGLMAGMAALALIGFLVWRNQNQRLRNQQLLAEKDRDIQASVLQQTRTELELKALRSQMNPHFIFNCMNGINRLILEKDTEGASRSLTRFAKLVRKILEHSEREYISLQEELELLETYLQLEQQRLKGSFSYQIVVSPTLDTEDIELPSMVLQPFIENAIWHGLSPLEEREGQLSIRIQEKGEQLHCVVEDNGIGRKQALALRKEKALKYKSLALQVTQDRLNLMGKGEEELIEIRDLEDESQRPLGTQVHVRIPM